MKKFNPERELRKIQHARRDKLFIGVFLILLIISISSTYALYQVRYSKRIIYTKVAPFSSKDLDLAVYVDDVKEEAFPENMDEYILDYIDCDNEEITTAKWDSTQNGLSVLTKGPNKCDVYFSSKIEQEFAYTGEIQIFTAPRAGYYKLEVWGAKGNSTVGGAGGYSYGNVILSKNENIYIGVGGIGQSFNGGNDGGGGGATHIATASGELNSFASDHSPVLIVAGGGGGGAPQSGNMVGDFYGGAGGGVNGASTHTKWIAQSHSGYDEFDMTGGSQNAGGTGPSNGSFGLGGISGGGGGWFGGAGMWGVGGGGSGYIGSNRLVSGTTQTINGSNAGAGKAKITYLGNNF